MLTDIEIAQQTKLRPIQDVAADIGITPDDLEFYGKYKAKVTEELFDKLKSKPDGKLVLVTAINPTPAGEGKTTVTAGLGQAMNKIGKKAVVALLEDLTLFDIYCGEQIASGQKSLSFAVKMRAEDHTLTDSEADEAIKKALDSARELGVSLRQ